MKHSIDEIATLYKGGSSSREIARALNVSSTTVNYYINKAERMGLVSKRSRKQSAILAQRKKRKHSIDEHFFDKIDSQEKAYILGFIYADGYNNEKNGKIEINIAESDKEILEKINASLRNSRPILTLDAYRKDGHNRQNKACIRIASRTMSDSLAKLGCKQAKSFNCKFPSYENVPEDIFNHFLRGYFDGDGCVTYSEKNNDITLSICGSYDFIKSLCELMNSKFDSNRNPNKNGSIFSFTYNGIEQVKKLHDYLYRNATIFLERKNKNYNNYIALYEQNSINYPKIAKYDLDNNLLEIYENTIDACKKNPGTFAANIWKACSGQYSKHKNFKWKFVS